MPGTAILNNKVLQFYNDNSMIISASLKFFLGGVIGFLFLEALPLSGVWDYGLAIGVIASLFYMNYLERKSHTEDRKSHEAILVKLTENISALSTSHKEYAAKRDAEQTHIKEKLSEIERVIQSQK